MGHLRPRRPSIGEIVNMNIFNQLIASYVVPIIRVGEVTFYSNLVTLLKLPCPYNWKFHFTSSSRQKRAVMLLRARQKRAVMLLHARVAASQLFEAAPQPQRPLRGLLSL